MQRNCRELVARVLDGDALKDTNADALSVMLDEKAVRSDADEWIAFEALLQALLAVRSAEEMTLSREKLLAKALLREKHHDRRRKAARASFLRRAVLAAAAAACLVAAVFVWNGGARRYPGPEVAAGRCTVVGGGEIRRGATLVTPDKAATLTLGGYCRIEAAPKSEIRIEGAEKDEAIFLRKGAVTCDVDGGEGGFAVRAAAGVASVEGTKFTVRIIPPATDGEPEKMHVTVVEGVVAVSGGDEVVMLAEGDAVTLSAATAAMRDDTEEDRRRDDFDPYIDELERLERIELQLRKKPRPRGRGDESKEGKEQPEVF